MKKKRKRKARQRKECNHTRLLNTRVIRGYTPRIKYRSVGGDCFLFRKQRQTFWKNTVE